MAARTRALQSSYSQRVLLPEHAGTQDDLHAFQKAFRLLEHPHEIFPLDLVHHATALRFSFATVKRESGTEDGRASTLFEHQRHFSEHVSGTAKEKQRVRGVWSGKAWN